MRIVSLAIVGFLVCRCLSSDPPTGSLAGSVSDEFGDPMVGATVMVKALSVGTITDLNGHFHLKGILYGVHVLEISYVSYKTLSLHITLVEHGHPSIEARLQPDSQVLADVVEVKGERIMDTAAVLHMKRKSISLMDGISSEQISKSGDSHLGQASRRIAGVTVEDGKYLYVRGLGDRYTKTILNGATVPGLDPERNAMQLDIFLSSLLNNVMVYKSFSPDLPGNFVGGLMNIRTKSSTPSLGIKVGVSYSYIPRVNLSNDFLSYTGSNTDWLGFDNNFRGVALTRLERMSLPVSSPTQFATKGGVLHATRSFLSQEMSPYPTTSFLNQKYFVSIGNGHKLFGRPLSWLIGGNYANNYQNYQEGTSAVYGNPATTSQVLTRSLFLADRNSKQTVTYNVLASASYEPVDKQKLELLFMENQKGISNSRIQTGEKPEDDPDLDYITHTLGYTERRLRTLQLSGKHGVGEGTDISWISSYTASTMEQPDLRFFTFGKRGTIHLVEPSIGQVPTRYFRDMAEDVRDNRVHIKRFLNSEKESSFVKTGFFYSATDRVFLERQFRYDAGNTIVPEGNPDLYIDEGNLWSADNPDGVYLIDGNIRSNSYQATRLLWGGYGMLSFALWADKLVVTTGARYERTRMRLKSEDESLKAGNLLLHDLLPAWLVTYHTHAKGSLKSSYGRTVARPTFRELAPYSSFDFVGGYVLQGNPALSRTLIDNFDMRYEYYPTPAEILSIGTFFKWFRDPIERTFNPQASNTELTYRNTESAYVVGAEVEVSKNMQFISPLLRNMSMGGNFSALYSQVTIDKQELEVIRTYNEHAHNSRPLFGQPPYTLNLSMGYEKTEAFSFNVAYNIIGDRISVISDGSTPNIYERSRHSLNANFVKTFARWQMKCSINNILNDDYLLTQSYRGNTYIFQQYRRGTSFSVGATYTMER